MDRRLLLDQELRTLSKNVYYQPPESFKIYYPCIIYHLNDAMSMHADDKYYYAKKRYTVTYITDNPDNDLVKKMLDTFQYCSFDRWYAAENLNHYVYDLYY